jgi:hypothetical protein
MIGLCSVQEWKGQESCRLYPGEPFFIEPEQQGSPRKNEIASKGKYAKLPRSLRWVLQPPNIDSLFLLSFPSASEAKRTRSVPLPETENCSLPQSCRSRFQALSHGLHTSSLVPRFRVSRDSTRVPGPRIRTILATEKGSASRLDSSLRMLSGLPFSLALLRRFRS